MISGCNKVNESDDNICEHCSLGYQLSNNKKKCELTNCTTIEEVCYQCEKGYFIADNGERCLKEDHVEAEEKEEEEEKKRKEEGELNTSTSLNPLLINVLYSVIFIIFLWIFFNSLKNTIIINYRPFKFLNIIY